MKNTWWQGTTRYSGRNIAAFKATTAREDLPNSKQYCTWNGKTMVEWRYGHAVNTLMCSLTEVSNEEVQ